MPNGSDATDWYVGSTAVEEVYVGSDLVWSAIPEGLIIMWAGEVVPDGWVLCDGQNGTPDLRDKFLVGSGDVYALNDEGGQNTITNVPSHTHNFSGVTTQNGAHQHNFTTTPSGFHSHVLLENGRHSHQISSDDAAHGHTIQYSDSNSNAIGGMEFADADDVFARQNLTNLAQEIRHTSFAGQHSHAVFQAGGHTHNLSTNGSHTHQFTSNQDGTHSHSVNWNVENAGVSEVDIRPPYYALAFIMKEF